MTFTQIRNQVNTLMRKYATEVAVYRARPLALEFCDEMTAAVTGEKPGPKLSLMQWAKVLHNRLTERGLHVRASTGLYDYLKRCLDRRALPQLNDTLRSLFPKAAKRGLIPRSIQPVSF